MIQIGANLVPLKGRGRAAAMVLLGVGCTTKVDDRRLVWPTIESQSWIVAASGSSPRLIAGEGHQPQLLNGTDLPITLFFLGYDQTLLDNGIRAGILLPDQACRSCALLAPATIAQVELTEDGPDSAPWVSVDAIPPWLADALTIDRANRCPIACSLLEIEDRVLEIPGVVTAAGLLEPGRALIAGNAGEMQIIEAETGPTSLCQGARATNSGAIRSAEEVWMSSNGMLLRFDPTQQRPDAPCVMTGTTAPEPLASMAVTDPSEPLEIVGIGNAGNVWHWLDGRWTMLYTLPPHSAANMTRRNGTIHIGSRRFVAMNGGSEVVLVDAGVQRRILVPFMRVDGTLGAITAVAWDPRAGLLLAVEDVGLVAIDLATGTGTSLVPAVKRLDSVLIDRGLLIFVDEAGLVTRTVAHGLTCEPSLLSGSGGRFFFALDSTTLVITDTSASGDDAQVSLIRRLPNLCGE